MIEDYFGNLFVQFLESKTYSLSLLVEDEDDEGMNKMEKYAIIHDGDLLYTITSEDPDVQRNMTKFMITLSDRNAGGFYLFWGEDDPETGRGKYTLIAVAKNGGLIS